MLATGEWYENEWDLGFWKSLEPLGEGARLTPACGTNNGPGKHTCTLTTPTAHRIVTLVTQLAVRCRPSSSLLHKAAESKAAVRVSTAHVSDSPGALLTFSFPAPCRAGAADLRWSPANCTSNKHPKSAELSVSSVRKEKHGHDCRSEDKDKKCGEIARKPVVLLAGDSG